MTSLATQLATPVFEASIETDAGTYRTGFHLGTDEAFARKEVESIFHHRRPLKGTRIITVGLLFGGELKEVFDGEWDNERWDRMWAEEAEWAQFGEGTEA